MPAQFFIITGLSGAGKSQALNILEDFGFFCVDNLPLELLPKFADLHRELKGHWNKVALGVDVRSGKSFFANLKNILEKIQAKGIAHKIIFFNANDATLLKRYSETRRRHPLSKRVIDGINKERKILEDVLALSDKEIDTSNLTIGELKEILAREMNVSPIKNMTVSVLSFGYKYGIPTDADVVIDVRFLPNPNYLPQLRYKTGMDMRVKRYVRKQKSSREFYAKFFNLLEFLLPLYVKEGKSHVTFAIGCTGGRHRSVTVAEDTAKYLRSKKYSVYTHHRDMNRC